MKTVDAKEAIAASMRFDLVFKFALAKAWAEGDAAAVREAEEAYLEMVRSRNGFWEDVPRRDKPEDFIEAFRRTAASIRKNGFDMTKPPIPVDETGEILDGAHRIACCAAYGFPCAVEKSDIWPAGGSVYKTFLKGHIHPSVRNWGVRKYLEFFPQGRLAEIFGDVAKYPLLPFPDWTARNRRALAWKLKPALSWLWCAAFLPFKSKGPKREKLLRRMLREKKKITGFSALARYWDDDRFYASCADASIDQPDKLMI